MDDNSVPPSLVHHQRHPAHLLRDYHHPSVCGQSHQLYAHTGRWAQLFIDHAHILVGGAPIHRLLGSLRTPPGHQYVGNPISCMHTQVVGHNFSSTILLTYWWGAHLFIDYSALWGPPQANSMWAIPSAVCIKGRWSQLFIDYPAHILVGGRTFSSATRLS